MKLFDIFKRKPVKEGPSFNIPDLNNLNEINNIQIPAYDSLKGIESPVNNIEYILQRKATEHKENGKMDLAIACLRKSNEIMPHSNFSYHLKDYLRLVDYLKINDQHEEARVEEQKLRDCHPELFITTGERIAGRNSWAIEYSNNLEADLLICSAHNITCGECAKYQGRVFSISGNDKRFPKLPDQIRETGTIHNGCRHMFMPFFEKFRDEKEVKKLIKSSNKPFVDNRSKEEKQLYEKKQLDAYEEKKDRENYEKMVELYPDISPKSFGGFRRMKKTQSPNYLSLVKKLKDKGLNIE